MHCCGQGVGGGVVISGLGRGFVELLDCLRRFYLRDVELALFGIVDGGDGHGRRGRSRGGDVGKRRNVLVGHQLSGGVLDEMVARSGHGGAPAVLEILLVAPQVVLIGVVGGLGDQEALVGRVVVEDVEGWSSGDQRALVIRVLGGWVRAVAPLRCPSVASSSSPTSLGDCSMTLQD